MGIDGALDCRFAGECVHGYEFDSSHGEAGSAGGALGAFAFAGGVDLVGVGGHGPDEERF